MSLRARETSFMWILTCGLALGGCFSPESDSDGLGGSSGEVEQTGSEGGVAGGSSDGSDAAESDAGSSGSADDEQAACDAYCGIVGDHCEGEVEQYSGEALCQSVCALMNEGSPDDALGNTVGCRATHALLAAEQPELHCAHAGPAGAGTCGASCESFCSLALVTCTGDQAQWPDAEACITDCDGWDPEPAYAANVPDAPTFACHMRHLTLAAAQAVPHCEHIGPNSPICI